MKQRSPHRAYPAIRSYDCSEWATAKAEVASALKVPSDAVFLPARLVSSLCFGLVRAGWLTDFARRTLLPPYITLVLTNSRSSSDRPGVAAKVRLCRENLSILLSARAAMHQTPGKSLMESTTSTTAITNTAVRSGLHCSMGFAEGTMMMTTMGKSTAKKKQVYICT